MVRHFTLILVFCTPLLCSAAELQPNQLYSGGTELTSSQIGLGLTIPQGWQGALPQGASVFVLEAPSVQANLFLVAEPATLEGLKAEMSKQIPLDGGITLTPGGVPVQKGDRLAADYSIEGRTDLKARLIGIAGSNGLGIVVITIAAVADFETAFAAAENLGESLRFSEPVAPVQAASGGGWQDYLRGRYIVRLYTGSGYREEEHIWLCSNGEFFRSTGSGGFGGGVSMASEGRGQGRWGAEGDTNGAGTLVLQYGAGSVVQSTGPGFETTQTGPGGDRLHYTLRFDGENLLLDGKRWFRDTNNQCQ